MRRIAWIALLAAIGLAGCGAPARAIDPTHFPTLAPPPAASPTQVVATATAEPTAVAIDPAVTCVPPSLMMHSKDRYLLQQTVIPFLVKNHYTTLTYRDYADILDGQKPMPQRPVLLSIDDIPADYINSYFRAMFGSLHDAGLVSTIAMNPNQPPEKTAENIQASWALVKSWSEWGMAVETHTVNHRYLPGALPPEVEFEIVESARRIAAGVGISPVALVLPYGAEDTSGNEQAPGLIPFSQEAHLKFLVGITGGRQITAGALPIPQDEYPVYVGRVGANKDQPGETLWEIQHWYCAVPACAKLAPINCSNPNATLTP